MGTRRGAPAPSIEYGSGRIRDAGASRLAPTQSAWEPEKFTHNKKIPMSFYHWQDQDLYLSLHIQPRSSRNEIVGEHNQRLKIKITAPPVDGQANAEIIKLLAKTFGVSKSSVSLISGETGREKRVCVHAPKNLIEGIQQP